MKKIKLLFILLIIINCQSQETHIVKKTIINNQDNSIHDKFNGIIEDFEENLKYWTYNQKNNTALTKVLLNNINVGKFIFNAPYSQEEYHTHINYIFYKRKMDFSKYRGIKFTAKGNSIIRYKIKIFEKEDYYEGQDAKEIWYKIFEVHENWEEYMIFFNEMQVEEYWEQDYVSDNAQVFTSIVGISITAQNISTRNPVKGALYIDNIELF